MKDKLKTAAGCLLFALVFGAVGVFASWVIFGTLYAGYIAQDWVLVKADVVSTVNDTVTYRYRLGEREFTNDRMGTFVMRSSDTDNGLFERAVEAKATNKPITVYVNPDDPAQSMIDRGVDWQPLVFFIPFMLGFGGVGFGALWMLYRTFVPAPASKGAGSGLAGLWFFTIMWNSIAMPIAILFVPKMIEEGEWLGLLVIIFPLIGVVMLWGALYGTWKAFIGLFKGGAPGGGLDLNKRAVDATPEEMAVVRNLVKKPRMVESNPEIIRKQALSDPDAPEPPRVSILQSLPEGPQPMVTSFASIAAQPEPARVTIGSLGEAPRAPHRERTEKAIRWAKHIPRIAFNVLFIAVLWKIGVFEELWRFVSGLLP